MAGNALVALPEGRVLAAASARIVLVPEPHPYEHENAAAIEANWQAEQARNPALFDGRTVLFSHVAMEDGILVGRCHDVRFASLLLWRNAGRSAGAAHLFAMAAPVTADGAVLLGRMGPHTANPGQVYFAGGSLEPSDFVGAIADLDGNMRREVEEEIGLDFAREHAEAVLHVLATPVGTVVMRRYRLAATAAEIERRVDAFIAAQADPEIVEPVLIRSNGPRDPAVMPFVHRVLDWHFFEAADF